MQLCQSTAMAIPRWWIVLACLLFGADALNINRKVAIDLPTTATTTTTWHSIMNYPDLYRFACPRFGDEAECPDMSHKAFKRTRALTGIEQQQGIAHVEKQTSCPTCSFRCEAYRGNCSVQVQECNQAHWDASGSNSPFAARDCNILTCMEHCACSSSWKVSLTDYYIGSPRMCQANCLRNYGKQTYEGQVPKTQAQKAGAVKKDSAFSDSWEQGDIAWHKNMIYKAIVKEYNLAVCLRDNLKDDDNQLFLSDLPIPDESGVHSIHWQQKGRWYPGPR